MSDEYNADILWELGEKTIMKKFAEGVQLFKNLDDMIDDGSDKKLFGYILHGLATKIFFKITLLTLASADDKELDTMFDDMKKRFKAYITNQQRRMPVSTSPVLLMQTILGKSKRPVGEFAMKQAVTSLEEYFEMLEESIWALKLRLDKLDKPKAKKEKKEMITPFDIYLISELDSLTGFFAISGVISILFIIALLMYFFITKDENFSIKPEYHTGHSLIRRLKNLKDWESLMKIFVTVFIFSLFFSSIIPSTNTGIAMYVIPKVVNSKATANYESLYASLPLDIQQLLQKKLKSELENN